jgi:hypothetical protein
MKKLPDIIKEFEIFDNNDLSISAWKEIFKTNVLLNLLFIYN